LAFPDDPLGVMVELYIGGAWVDITGDVYTNNLITITRGRQDEASRTDAGTCVFVLNNTGGRYSPRNPRSDLYGLIGRNTLVRVSIQPGGTSGARLIRFVGEVASWPPKWDTSRYVTVSASAAGILRRLGQGATPLASPMRREFTNPARTSILAYWPLEDGSTATEFASALSGAAPMTVATSGVKAAAYTSYAASDALPTLGEGALTGTVPTYTVTGETALRFFAAFPDTAPTADAPLVEVKSSTGMRWVIAWESTGAMSVRGYDKAGTTLEYITYGGVVSGKRLSIGLDFVQSGTTLTRRWYFIDVDEYTLASGATITQTTGTLTGYTLGRLATITIGGGSIGDVAIGHVALADATSAYGATGSAMVGYAGESALARLIRLCGEEDIPFTYKAVTGLSSAQVGPQSVAALLDLIEDAIDADGGRLYEQRDALALTARSRATLYTQTPALTLDYANGEVAPPLEPVDDDQHVHNDVTVQREGGSSARAVADTGPLAPDVVGRYSETSTLNLYSDEQCAPLAWWTLHLGTWDAPRYPSVSVEVHNAPQLAEDLAAVDVGDRAVITNPPAFLPPEQIELLVEGYTETLGVRTWDITFNASPGGPYLVAMTDDAEYGTADTDGSILAASATATDTALMVRAVAGSQWVQDPADLPFTVTVGGEEIRVTSVGPAAADTFTRTVANGWGTSDSGQPWQVLGGPAASFSVNGSKGIHSIATRNLTHTITLPAVSLADAEMVATFTMPVMPTGDGIWTYVMLRANTAATNFYFARVYFATAGTAELSLRKRLPAESLLSTYGTKLTHTAGASYAVRFRVEGSALSVRFWQTTDPEPSAWQLTSTDTDITAPGGVGLRSYTSSTNTNTLPLVIPWDNFRITNAQKVGVDRSVNGVVKAQPAGASVGLIHPALAAL
jgi:hypothetical protein